MVASGSSTPTSFELTNDTRGGIFLGVRVLVLSDFVWRVVVVHRFDIHITYLVISNIVITNDIVQLMFIGGVFKSTV